MSGAAAHIDKLVHSANQIGRFFAGQGDDAQAVSAIADHLTKFWEPRLREEIIAHVDSGGAGLDPLVLVAIRGLARLRHG